MHNYCSIMAWILVSLMVQAKLLVGQSKTMGTAPSQERSLITESDLTLEGTTPTMAASLIRNAGLSGGVATLHEDCSQGSVKSVSIAAGVQLGDALNRISALDTPTRWEIHDRIVNGLPVGDIPTLLEVRVGRIEWDRAASVRELIDQVKQRPEVTRKALELRLSEAPFEGGSGTLCLRGDCGSPPRPETQLETDQDITLIALLNRIVTAHKGAVWSYSEYRCADGAKFSLSALSE